MISSLPLPRPLLISIIQGHMMNISSPILNITQSPHLAHHRLPQTPSSLGGARPFSIAGGLILNVPARTPSVPPFRSSSTGLKTLVFSPNPTSAWSSASASLRNKFKMSFMLSLPTALPSIAASARARFLSWSARMRSSTVRATVSLYTVTSTVWLRRWTRSMACSSTNYAGKVSELVHVKQ